MYRDILNDLKESARIITNDGSMNPTVKANQLEMIDIMQVDTYNVLVSTSGDVPYSQSLDDQQLFPFYDGAKTIKADLMRRLAMDISNLNVNSYSFSASEDIVFQGSVSKWISFTNWLQIRMALTIADIDNTNAKVGFGGHYGGYQAILYDAVRKVHFGASESRKDGAAAGY